VRRVGFASAMLTDHRRALRFSLMLLAAMLFMLIAVGRHPEADAPTTTLAFIGNFDETVLHWMDDIRNVVLTGLFRFLNVAGGGYVTIPLRVIVTLLLLLTRRFRAMFAFLLTWAASEALLTWFKIFFHRGRPPDPLVATTGFSFPSGHAVAGAAIAVALVLVALSPGPKRLKWELGAMGFAFLMGFSRVYLSAHWFSDVVAGVLLGAGIAIGSAALVTEIANLIQARKPAPEAEPPQDPLDPVLD
jgi:membrane-associated phospholipid phosphatase